MKKDKSSKVKLHDDEDGPSDAVKALLSNTDSDTLLKANGIYYIYGEISDGSLLDIHKDVLLKHYMGKKHFNNDLTFIINSEGGLVSESSALIDLLTNIRLDIRTVGLGQCLSAGAMLLAMGTKGKRVVGQSTTIMIHQYSWGIVGKHHELVAHRNVQDNFYEQEIAFWIKHSKYKTEKEVVKHLLRKEDTFLTAKEALNHGIIDAIGDVLR